MEYDQMPSGGTTQNIVSQFKDVDAYLAFLRPPLNGIAKTFSRNCEVVLHDFRDPEHSIVAIVGDVTHRHIVLDRRGVFVLQRAVPQVAEYLGLSRATVYSYLAAIREEG